MENKKTKLTVSGKIKKTINDFEASRSQKKKTVIINNQSNKSHGKTVGNKTKYTHITTNRNATISSTH